jgi:flagellar biosynthesis/type III secretory pathway chaperone
MADDHWATLLAVLEDLIQVHQELVGVLQAEKRIMAAADLDELLPCLAEKERLLSRVRELDQRRVDAVAALAGCVSDDTVKLSQLVAFSPPPYVAGLLSCQARLESLTVSMNELNQINGIVAERALARVNGLLVLLQNLADGTPTYQPSGLLHQDAPGGRTLGRG